MYKKVATQKNVIKGKHRNTKCCTLKQRQREHCKGHHRPTKYKQIITYNKDERSCLLAIHSIQLTIF